MSVYSRFNLKPETLIPQVYYVDVLLLNELGIMFEFIITLTAEHVCVVLLWFLKEESDETIPYFTKINACLCIRSDIDCDY